MCELTSEELWLVVRLYAFALSPVFLGLFYLIKKKHFLQYSFNFMLNFFYLCGWI